MLLPRRSFGDLEKVLHLMSVVEVCLMSRLHPCEGCLSWPLEEKTTAEGSLARGKQSTTLAHDILPPIHDWMLRAE